MTVPRRQAGFAARIPTKALLFAGLLAMISGPPPAHGQDLPGDAARGQEFARTLCAICHAVEPEQTQSTRLESPPFSEVAADPATTPLGLRVFLRTPHKSMPNFMLSETETDDIIAYIISLK